MEIRINKITEEIREKFENNPVIVMDNLYKDVKVACEFSDGKLSAVIFE